MVEQLEDLALILGCLPLFFGHLLHWDLLNDHQLLVSLAQAQVHNPGDTEHRGESQLSFQPHVRQGRPGRWMLLRRGETGMETKRSSKIHRTSSRIGRTGHKRCG